MIHLCPDLLHGLIYMGNFVCALLQPGDHLLRMVHIFLVLDLMFQTCPEVHSDGSDLHLRLYFLCGLGKKDGNAYDQMKTAVAVGLGILDIVFSLDQPNIVLLGQGIGQKINIVNIRTYHSYPCNVIQIIFYIFPCRRQSQFCHLFQNAHLALQTGLNGTDRVSFIPDFKLRVQHLKLCVDLFDRTGISHH